MTISLDISSRVSTPPASAIVAQRVAGGRTSLAQLASILAGVSASVALLQEALGKRRAGDYGAVQRIVDIPDPI